MAWKKAKLEDFAENQRQKNEFNKKMKALRLLIPNSKKADKASILEEAIEYVKQLQHQVQMLSSPNKMNPSYVCVPMGIPCFQMPQMCMNMNSGCIGVGINMVHSNSQSQWSNGCMTMPQAVQGQANPWTNDRNKECFHTVGLTMFTKISEHNNECEEGSINTS